MQQLFSNVLSIIAALLLLSFFVIVHELGHFGVARLLGFRVVEFAVGMGPKLWGKERKGILYSVRAFPIGGMCRFYGEDEGVKDSESFHAQKVWKRILVVAAGPVMNLIFALLFAATSLMAYGAIVAQVDGYSAEETPAEQAGMLPGDILYAVDGQRIEYYNDSIAKIRAIQTPDTVITVERNGEKLDLLVRDVFNEEAGYNMLGVNIRAARRPYGFFEAIGGSFAFVGALIREMFGFLGGIFTKGVQPGDVAGPVGTITVIGSAVRMGFEVVLQLAVLISVNLGILNLLPFPALDGGRLVFLAIEGVRRKPIAPEKEGMVHFVGLVLLFGLIILLTYQDIARLLGGG